MCVWLQSRALFDVDVCVATDHSCACVCGYRAVILDICLANELTFENFFEPLCYLYTLGGPQPKRMRLMHSWAGQFSSDQTFENFYEFLCWSLCVCVCEAKHLLTIFHMGWLRLVGSLKL